MVRKLLEDGQEVLEVIPEQAGETILTVYDNQDNVDTVRVIVGGSGNVWGETGTGSTGSGWVVPPTDAELLEIETDIQWILRDLELEWINISSENIEINSAENAFRCEDKDSKKFWVRPYYASCVDNTKSIAWKCNTGYEDLYERWINSCVKKEYLKYLDTDGSITFSLQDQWIKLQWDAQEWRRRAIITTFQTKLNGKSSFYISTLQNKLIDLRNALWTTNSFTQQKRDLAIFVLDDVINSLDTNTNLQTKEKQDLYGLYKQLQLYANNGKYSGGEFWYFPYSWKSRTEIDASASRFAQKQEEYLYNYSEEYKNGLNTYTSQIASNSSESLSEITRWAREGVVEGTKDYIMSYYDTANSLAEMDFEDVKSWVKWLWSKVSNPVVTLSEIRDEAGELYDIIVNIDEIIADIVSYKKWYYPSYLWTNLSLSFIPAWRLKNVIGKTKETEKMKEIIDWNKIGFLDKNTVLWNKSIFWDSGRRFQNSKIYKNNNSGNYFYRDPAWYKWEVWHHHLEVFDSKYSHIWVADPITGIIDYSKAVSGRSISNIMK